MKTLAELEQAIEQLIEQIDNLMLRMRNGYLEQERSHS
jgi:hypothetical protein